MTKNVVGFVEHLLDAQPWVKPFALLKDGYHLHVFLFRWWRVLRKFREMLQIMMRDGLVRFVDKVGNDEADAAADSGTRRHHGDVVGARNEYIHSYDFWFPVVQPLHRFLGRLSMMMGAHCSGPTAMERREATKEKACGFGSS